MRRELRRCWTAARCKLDDGSTSPRRRPGLRRRAAGRAGAGRRRDHAGRRLAAGAAAGAGTAAHARRRRPGRREPAGPAARRRRRRAPAGAAGRDRDRRHRAPAPVIAAVAHGEMLTLAPFGSADGVVARAVSRLVTIATGLDPHGLGVPEVFWMRRAADYRDGGARLRRRDPGWACGAGWCCVAGPCAPARRRRCRSPNRSLNRCRDYAEVGDSHAGRCNDKSGRRSEGFGSPPASTDLGYQACNCGLRGWPRRSCDASGCSPTQRAVDAVRFSQLRRPATLLPLSRL